MTANSLVMTMPPITTPVPGFVPPAIAETLILADPGFVHLIISFPLYMSGRVRILTHIPFNELAAFYQMATLFVYPSFFEGFGIPILEAQLAGIPVIAATGSCLEEAGGSSALYTDPRNEQELRGLIESVLNEPKLAEPMRSGGRENIRRFMPDVLAAHFMRVYENISRS